MQSSTLQEIHKPNMFRRDGMTFRFASGAAVLLILLPLARARLSSPSSKTGTSDHDPHFDFYVFSMSFQPEFCYEHKRDDFDGCRHPNDEWRGALTIHVSWVRFAERKLFGLDENLVQAGQ